MRTVIATDGQVSLAVPADDDRRLIDEHDDGVFEVDPDDRPHPPPAELGRAVVLADGELVGVMSWHLVQWGRTRACGAWNLGVGLLPSARGRGIGAAAIRLLIRHLFAAMDLDRVEASTDVDNTPAQRALEAAGFRREGVVRGAQLRGGVRRDMVLYGILRSDHK